MLVDSHCHIDFKEFDMDRDQILYESLLNLDNGNKLTGIIVPGVHKNQWSMVANLSQKYPSLFYSIGVHPWFLEEYMPKTASDLIEDLFSFLSANFSEKILNDSFVNQSHDDSVGKSLLYNNCVAIGECGLDKTRDLAMSIQQDFFAAHLDVAKQKNLPLIIHAHKADNEIVQQIKSSGYDGSGVIHAFSGSYELAKTYVDMGFYLGVGGVITYARARKTRDAIRRLPLSCLVLETDAPSMPLSGQQGQRNHPGNLVNVAKALAELRGDTFANIVMQTGINSGRLFNINFSEGIEGKRVRGYNSMRTDCDLAQIIVT